MRLGQLARKLSVRPSQIVDILAKHQQFLEDGSNAKLTDDLVKQIVLHFAPDRLSEIMAVQTQEEPEPQPNPEPETVVAESAVEKIELHSPKLLWRQSPRLWMIAKPFVRLRLS
jgi:hypothetical protein